MNFDLPRLVIVTRPTPLDMLKDRFGTLDQARFYVKSRGQSATRAEQAHERQARALKLVVAAIPAEQKRVMVQREELDRFLFLPNDVILAVGQDGLVPNVAKYLDGQLLVGFNPDKATWPGVLCRHDPADAAALIAFANRRQFGFAIAAHTMVRVQREDGQELHALNELFVGHHSHQSAKYHLRIGEARERHSSSGVIVATGTGATGWAASIVRQRQLQVALPDPCARRLAYLVREPWPSAATGATLDFGFIEGEQRLELVSEMERGGVIFGDGIEADFLEFNEGQVAAVGLAARTLNLVVPAPTSGVTAARRG